MEVPANSANIIRIFVEDYPEKQEENFLFPRFKKTKKLTELIDTLLQQHQVRRRITDLVMQLSKSKKVTASENKHLVQLLTAFNKMYRPHEAREDTVLFPKFRKIVSKNEDNSLGEQFEKK